MGKIWTKKEDELLCIFCIEQYIIKESCESIEPFVSQFVDKIEFLGRSSGSIRMRIQNIKAVLEMHKIHNTIPVTPLVNFAAQTEVVLLKLLREYNYKK